MTSSLQTSREIRTRARARTLRIVVIGLLSGFLSGIFGVGGGILIVPLLVMVLRMDQRLAHGTSLAAVLPIAVSGSLGYALDDKIDWAAAVCLVLSAATLGAVLGTHLLHIVPRRGLALSFSAVLAVTAVRLALEESDAAGRGDLTVGMVVALLLIGMVAGTLAGLLGVGGGVFMVPAMVVLLGISPVVAKGTSLAVIIPTAVIATRRNLTRGNVDLGTGALVGVSGMASSFVASQISLGLDDTVSNRLFAVLLLALAVKMAASELRRAPA